MSLKLNTRCQAVAGAYIAAGDVEREEPWSPAATALEALLADEAGRYFLGLETNTPADDPNRWRYPVGLFADDGFRVWKSALEAIIDVATDSPAIQGAAEALLAKIDVSDGEGSSAADDGGGEAEAGGGESVDDGPKPPEEEPIPEEGADPPLGGGGAGRSMQDLEVRGMPPRPTEQQLIPARFGLTAEALRSLPAEERERRAALIDRLEAGDTETLAACRAQLVGKADVSGEDLQRTFGTNAFARTLQIRAASLDRESRTVGLSFSSEVPCPRWWGEEILGHKKNEVRLERLNTGGPLLRDHWSFEQIGVVEKAWIDGPAKLGRALVRFSRSALGEEMMTDVEDRIRRSTSVGYVIHAMKLIEVKKEGDTEVSVYRVTDWEPLEVSLVSMPADITVGVDRSAAGTLPAAVIPKEVKMPPEVVSPTAAAPVQDPSALKGAGVLEERERVKAISALVDAHKLPAEMAQKAIADGTSIEDFRQAVLTAIATKPLDRPSVKEIGLSAKEVKNYSILKLIRGLAATKNVPEYGQKYIEEAGLEFEAGRAICQKFGIEAKGVLVPIEVMRAPSPRAEQRDLQVGLDTAGGYLVATTLLGMIPMLRAKSLLLRMGAIGLGGLVGDAAIPKQTASGTAYWLNEGVAPTESQAALGQLDLRPKTVGAYTDITRKLLKQASLDVEAFVRDDLARTLATEIDRVGINGSGVNGEPLGILNTTGIGAVTGAGGNGTVPSWAEIVAIYKEVAIDNADIGTLGFLTDPKAAAKMMATPKESGQAVYIMNAFDSEGFGELMGLRVGVSTNVPSNLTQGTGTNLSAILFGNFLDLAIASWGVLDLNVDAAALSTSGGLRVIALQDIDIALRRQQSFAAKKDTITT